MNFKKGELYYDKKIPTDIVQKIGGALIKDSIFQDSRETSAKLIKPDSIYQLLIVFDLSKLTPAAVEEMRYMGLRYSEDFLNSAALDIIVTDDEWKPKQTLPYRTLGKFLTAKESRLFYSSAAGEGPATKLRDFLVEEGFFNGGYKVVRLDKTGEGYVIQLYSDEKTSRTAAEEEELKAEMKDWAQKVFDSTPITLQLADLNMKPFLTIKPS